MSEERIKEQLSNAIGYLFEENAPGDIDVPENEQVTHLERAEYDYATKDLASDNRVSEKPERGNRT